MAKADGNYHPDPNFDMEAHKAKLNKKETHYYITLDAEGNEVQRAVIGRGRPRKDFVRQDNGDFVCQMADEAPESEAKPEVELAEETPEEESATIVDDALVE